jgi:aspartate racemase
MTSSDTMPDAPLRRVGLIGGTSWESTAIYYRLLNQAIRARRGGSASAAVTVHSLDFAPVHAHQLAGEWDELGAELATAARALQAGGSQAVAVAANTLHLVADRIRDGLDVEFIDLVDIVGATCAGRGWSRVGLLGTGYTMDSPMYPDRLATSGISVIVPAEADRDLVHSVIYDELTVGIVSERSRGQLLAVVERLAGGGAEAVILGCTELGILLRDGDAVVPLLDTTQAHCDALTEFMLVPASGAMSARAKSNPRETESA